MKDTYSRGYKAAALVLLLIELAVLCLPVFGGGSDDSFPAGRLRAWVWRCRDRAGGEREIDFECFDSSKSADFR